MKGTIPNDPNEKLTFDQHTKANLTAWEIKRIRQLLDQAEPEVKAAILVEFAPAYTNAMLNVANTFPGLIEALGADDHWSKAVAAGPIPENKWK